jgi:DNA-binding CsgD family transcriptional regulator
MDPGDRTRMGLLDRDDELGALSAALERACAGDGGLVLVEGPPGIGKSSLLEVCADRADRLGMTVAWARGDEIVMESAFAGVRELLWPQVRAIGPRVFDGAVGLAATVFAHQEGARAEPDRVGTVLHGLYWLVAELAERAPLLLVVDDAHWLDRASSRFLVYLSRRVRSLPVLLAVGMRSEVPPASIAVLCELATGVLRPGPLSQDATRVLVRGELGPQADDAVCRSCHEATGGNPFYLRELVTALSAEDARPTVEVARRVRSLGAGTIGRNLLFRIVRLGPDCERLVEALAILGAESPLRRVAALAGLEPPGAEIAADKLRRADLLAPTPTLSFVHPIVHEAITAELPPSRRRALHGQAAALLAGDQAPADLVAAHLLFSEPYGEPWVVHALRAAARQAVSQGAPEAAASYLRRALDEPPRPDLRLELLIELGRAEALLSVAPDFASLREALELARTPEQRIEVAHELALSLANVGSSIAARDLLETVLETAAELDAPLLERLEAHLIGTGAADLSAAPRLLVRARPRFARLRRDEVTDPVMLSALAHTGALTGRLCAEEVAGYARLALDDPALLQLGAPYVGAASALSIAGELEEAGAALEDGLADAQRRGSAPLFMAMSSFRAATAYRAGQLDLAEDYGRRALDLGRELGVDLLPTHFLMPVLIELGRAAEALALTESLVLAEPDLQLWHGVVVLAERGRARVALGELESGVADLVDADQRATSAGLHLSTFSDWWPSAAAGLARLGRRDEARVLAGRELADAVAFGSHRRHGIMLSVSGGLDPTAEGLAALRQAAAILERSPAELEHGRALVNLGSRLRELGQLDEARGWLTEGLDLAHRHGAVSLGERAREELLATGARPRHAALRGPEALTPAELRTARMASEGLTNRQIAQTLFVTAKTVETHLSHAYSKLGIASRSKLVEALAAAGKPEVAPAKSWCGHTRCAAPDAALLS